MDGPRWGVAVVRGRSMRPLLQDGDRLLVSYAAPVRPGDLALVRLPDGTAAVKRAAFRDGEGWWISSEHPDGVHSGVLGQLPDGALLARVRCRVWPRPRWIGRW